MHINAFVRPGDSVSLPPSVVRGWWLPVLLVAGLSSACPAAAQQPQALRQDGFERQRQRQELRQQLAEQQRNRALQERAAHNAIAADPSLRARLPAVAPTANPYPPPAPAGYRVDGAPRLSVEEKQQLRRQLREAYGQGYQPPGQDAQRP